MTSATPGYLIPAVSPAPLQDDALENFLGDVVAGITGLDRNTLVRPRWQEDPPNMPGRSVTWCGIGVTNQAPDTNAALMLASDGTSQDLIRHETLTIIASFYGPLSGAVSTQFRDGLQIDQNCEQLLLAGFGLISADGPTKAPELIKEKWYQRSDITWLSRREVRRTYPVLSLISAHGTIYTDHQTDPFDTANP